MSVRATTLMFATVLAVGPMTAWAQSDEAAFLTDYSKLRAAPDNPFEELYVAPNAAQRAAQYTAIMVDQPELFIHPDSKYKGIKPDDMKAIADALREKVTAELKGGGYQIVDVLGPHVLYVRLAVGDLMLQKKRRPILGYAPASALEHSFKQLATKLTSNVDLKSLKIEGEVLDSVTLEQYGAMTASRGSISAGAAGNYGAPITWAHLNDLFSLVGKRLRCRLDNQKLPQSRWDKCGTIGLAAVKPG